MCYSKEYNSRDGLLGFFRTGEMTELAGCKTSYYMAGGTRKRYKKYKAKSKKRKGQKKKI